MTAPTQLPVAVEDEQHKHALAPAATQQFSLTPRNFDELMKMCELLASSEMIPKEYIRKPGNILVAVQWGAEIGLKPLQAMQNIATINGRPSLWGDSMLALVRASPLCMYVREKELPDGTAEIRTMRRGDPQEHVGTFSDKDAATAGLKGKAGPWTSMPRRMKQLRARAFLLRDVYTDVLRGMEMAEVLMDYPAGSWGGPPADGAVENEMLDSWIAKAKAVTTDAEAVAVYNEGLKAMGTSDVAAAGAFKKAVIERRTELRNASATDVQPKAELTPGAPENDGAQQRDGEVMTYAKLADMVNKATDRIAVEIAAEWLPELPDDQQPELQKIIDAKLATFPATTTNQENPS